MQPIYPITAETVIPHIGRPVCAVMKDGTHHYGILRGIGDGQLYLDGGGGELRLSSLKKKQKKNRISEKAKTNAFLGFGGFGFGFGLSLALLASLFLLPFFFI